MIPLPLPLPFPERAGAGRRVDYEPVLDRLAGSTFRRRKRLLGTELEQLRARGIADMAAHARGFVAERLAPAQPANDGRQTPYRGHPVFIAQHATATCCRACLETWHRIPKGRPLAEEEAAWVAGLIEAWLRREIGLEGVVLEAAPAPAPAAPASRRPPRLRRRRRSEILRLVAEDDGESAAGAAVTPDVLLLEEREADGTLLRRWLQLELFAAAEERLPGA